MSNQLLKKYGRPLRSRKKLFIIAFLLLFAISSVAWWNSRCIVDVNSVPIQITLSGKHGDVTTLSEANEARIFDFPPGFSAFVTAVTEHLAAKLAQERVCLNSIESREHSLLQFVPWGIYLISPEAVPPLEARPLGVCRISSPWVDLVIERKPVPSVRGIIRYNEHQLLADQAVLAGARNVPPGVAMPFTYDEFKRYADLEYAPSEIHHQPTEKPIEERVPSELLWLFRRADHEQPVYFSGPALGSMRVAMKAGAEGYTKIVIAVIDHCLASEGAAIQFNSILDVADLVPLEQFKIVTPIISIPEH